MLSLRSIKICPVHSSVCIVPKLSRFVFRKKMYIYVMCKQVSWRGYSKVTNTVDYSWKLDDKGAWLDSVCWQATERCGVLWMEVRGVWMLCVNVFLTSIGQHKKRWVYIIFYICCYNRLVCNIIYQQQWTSSVSLRFSLSCNDGGSCSWTFNNLYY